MAFDPGIYKSYRNHFVAELKDLYFNPSDFRGIYDPDKLSFTISPVGDSDLFFSIKREDEFDRFYVSSNVYFGNGKTTELIFTSVHIDEVYQHFQLWLDGQLQDPRMKGLESYYQGGVGLYLIEKQKLEEEENQPDLWDQSNDPIIDSYQEEFYQDFEIIEEDADITPFNLEQQLYLDSYIKQLESKVEKAKEIDNKISKKDIDEIKQDIKELKSSLTKESKKKVIFKLSTILAKVRKASLILLKEAYLSAQGEIIATLVKGLIN